MVGLVIALVAGLLVSASTVKAVGQVWAVVWGVAAFMLIQLLIGIAIRFLMKSRQAKLQSVMLTAQEKINRQMTIYQRRPPSSMREAQETVNRIQNGAAREMLDILDRCKPLTVWNMMLGRQLNAMRVQLFFQLKEFKKVDELLPKSLLLDQQSMAIKMVRMYRNGDTGLDKFYARKCSRMKGDAAAFLASVYAWIKIRQENTPAAVDALVGVKKRTDNPIVLENCDHLLNGKVKHFSNSGWGDAWYSLMLEEPKIKAQRQARMF